jgi:assimilatory nitrate reductase catalytic subunit
MGSRLFSNTSSLFAGRDFTSPDDRRDVAEILDIDPSRIPTKNSWSYDQIIDGMQEGTIRGVWIVCTNPAHSWIDQSSIHRLLSKLDFVVVQDIYHSTETARLAHLVLPAAGWGEKEGTLINSERRFGLVKRVVRSPGEALSDFSIFKLISERWGCGAMFRRWSSPEAAFEILRDLSRGRPCDFSGIEGYEAIDRSGGVQWPCPEASLAAITQRRLFEDGRFYHADQRARFVWDTPRPMPESVDAQYPYLLLTGRGTAAQWHTQSRTAKSPILRQLYPKDAYLEMHPSDACRELIRGGDIVSVSSRRGSVRVRVCITPTVQIGQVFLPMHYEITNQLTNPQFDPHSRQPSYKDCAVRIERVKQK